MSTCRGWGKRSAFARIDQSKGETVTPTEMILRYFKYDHLPPQLQEVSKPFCEMAENIASGGTSGPETTTALRKLLEAKDCYVRAHLNEKYVTGGPFAAPTS